MAPNLRERALVARITISLLAAGAWLGSSGEAAALACGDVITEDTTLEHDLLDCPGDGLIIGADNVTLRLNGFMIDHLSDAADVSLKRSMFESTDAIEKIRNYISARSEPVGIDIDGYKRVKIFGPGVIRDFFFGVNAFAALRVRVTNLTILNTLVGIAFNETTARSIADGNTIISGIIALIQSSADASPTQNSIVFNSLNRASISLGDAGRNLIGSNSIFEHSAISLDDNSDRNIINDNRIFGANASSFGAAIGLTQSNFNKITNNKVNGPISIGVPEDPSSENEIYINTVQGARVGIEVRTTESEENVIKANRLFDKDNQISDEGTGTIIADNFCDPPDDDPPCSTDFDPGEVVDNDVDSILDGNDHCGETDFQAAVVVNGIDTNIANVLTERTGCTMMDLIHEAAVAADDRRDFIGAIDLLTRTWIDDDLIDEEDAGIIRRAAAGSPLF